MARFITYNLLAAFIMIYYQIQVQTFYFVCKIDRFYQNREWALLGTIP